MIRALSLCAVAVLVAAAGGCNTLHCNCCQPKTNCTLVDYLKGPCGSSCGCETGCSTGCSTGGCSTGCDAGCSTGCNTGCKPYCDSLFGRGCRSGCNTCGSGCNSGGQVCNGTGGPYVANPHGVRQCGFPGIGHRLGGGAVGPCPHCGGRLHPWGLGLFRCGSCGAGCLGHGGLLGGHGGHGGHGGNGLLGQRGPHPYTGPYTGPSGPPTGTYGYPYYTIRAPRDFLQNNPPSIGR